jgi:NitT/TauT family transport system substrate-binding protein
MKRSCLGAAAAIALLLLGGSHPAGADPNEVKIGGVYGLASLPVYVAMELHLVEAQAKALGLPDVKASFRIVSGGANAADLLVSGNVDVAAASITNMMVLWDKTRSLKQKSIRGIMPLTDSPVFLITTDPTINSLRDFKDTDRIAVTNVKVSIQAIVLAMAAAKEFGWEERFKFDPRSVAMPHEDGMAALLSGGGEVKTQAAQLPFSVIEMDSGKAHLLLTSTDVLDGPHSIAVAVTTDQFRSERPKLYAAVVAAFQQAIEFINGNKRAAAEIYVKYEPQKNGVDWIYNILQKPELINFTSTPHGNEKIADFMFKTKLLRNRPESWKDLYWEGAPAKDGN